MLSISCEFGEGWVEAAEIDRVGLAKALRIGIKRALRAIQAQIDEEIILDGKINYAPKRYRQVRCVVRADSSIPLVSVASIYAKVRRDAFMVELAKQHPDYGFASHVGYGTKLHCRALGRFGTIDSVHRLSFKPLRTAS